MEGMGLKERKSLEVGNVALARRLRRRRGEIEQALTRICGAGKPGGVRDPEHFADIDATFAAVTAYNFDCIEKGEYASDPLPTAAISHARSAARSGMALDDFLVGVIAAQNLLNDFILQESHDLTGETLSGVQALQGSILLRFASELAGEYKREEGRLRQSADRRQNALIERLLSGAPVAKHEISYILDRWHTGLVISGGHAKDAARILSELLGTALLVVPRGSETAWAWLGGHRRITSQLIEDALAEKRGIKARFAVGEPGRNVEGWRSTHFEAKAARAVAIRQVARVTCFSQVAMEAMALQTPDLAQSLRTTYLGPLAGSRGRGAILRQTLRAYFASGRNVSSAAVSLEVSRRTVENRLRIVEQELGRPLAVCGSELELALRLEALDPG